MLNSKDGEHSDDAQPTGPHGHTAAGCRCAAVAAWQWLSTIGFGKTSTFMQAFLDTQPQSLTELPIVDEALKAFKEHIIHYRKVLNDEGVWLFLSTVGCWGVGHPVYQLVAYVVTIFLFGSRVASRYRERKAFPKIAAELERRIKSETTTPDARTRQVLVLEQLKKTHLSGLRPFLAAGVFFVSWIFYGASFGYAIVHLFMAAA